MVSPCKKKKVEKKGRAPQEPSASKNNLGSKRLKSSKPLSEKKFYLDIKNHVSLRQIEAKLTSLGAKLELFLVKDVDYVVTDRDDYPRHSRQLGLITPSPFCSVSPAVTDSPTDGVISKRTRSRAEAMLERVKQQPQKNTIDILDNAAAWRIPIYPLSKFLVWLEKLLEKRRSAPGVRELRGHYLKVETGVGRPDFRQFRAWPRLCYSDEEPAAFPPPKPLSRHDPQRMTRKVGKTGKDGTSAVGGGNGYCEICRVHYDQLDTHVSSNQHTKLVSDPTQYSQLDSLITHHELGNVTSLRKSLRIAKSPPIEMGGKQSNEAPPPPPPPPMPSALNGHVTRSRIDKVLCNGLTSSEKRKKEMKPSGGANEKESTKEKEKEILTREREREISTREREREISTREREREICTREREREISTREREREREISAKEKEREKEIAAREEEKTATEHNLRSRHSTPKQPTPQPKRNRLSRKRLSVEEKLIEDNRSYYKVEVLNSKLRSTEYFIAQKQLEARVNGTEAAMNGCEEKAEEKEVKEPVVVRFKKVRKTQLAVLSDEAENFMFGDLTRKEMESKADSDSSEDSGRRADSDSSSEEETPRKKKKRKSFISPNRKRDSGTCSPRSRFNQSTLVSHSRVEDKSDEEDQETTLADITFFFEKPPKDRPWIDSLEPEKRQSSFYFPHYHEYPKIMLPFEYPISERLKLLSGRRGIVCGRRRDRLSRLLDEGKPRKSPRCHASTLAIMSSLMRRRPIRECTSNPDFTYEEESRSSLPETVESSSSASDVRLAISDSTLLPVDPAGDAYAIALARLACGETNTFQVPPGPCLPVDPSILSDPPPIVNLMSEPGLEVPLDSLVDQAPPPNLQHKLLDFEFRFPTDADSGSDCSDLIGFADDGRGVSGRRRKRKRNLTGWPIGKPKKKIVKTKEETPPPPTVIKCEPCEIKLEPLCQEMLDQFPFKDGSSFGDDSVNLPVIPIKRGRGRPRKYPLNFNPSSFSSPPVSPKSSPKKKCIPRFTFGPRRSCIK